MSAVARALCAAAVCALLAAPSAFASKPAPRHAAAASSLATLRSAGIDVSRAVRPVLRRSLTVDEPALAETYLPGMAWEWQWDAARMSAVPDTVLRAAAGVKIAVIDSGADLRAPDLADKRPASWSVLSRSR